VYIFVLESFLWATPKGLKTFKMDAVKAEHTKVLAFNQGFYNLGLTAGLVWAFAGAPEQFMARATFFLATVAVAGVIGGLSAARSILFVQTVPAVLALAFLYL
ncbi:MAG: DUF1304 domain-containing protein, partial [Deltaproteobacteria bacterium]|nr:DUF1304 domain-containing protein [Deltaproteobacteria bacterium]